MLVAALIAPTRLLPAFLALSAIAGCSNEGDKNPGPGTEAAKSEASASVPIGKGFDFYVLSLSWSPTWCRANDPRKESEQCERGSGLIVHGLWPQNERGYPQFCATRQSDRVPESLGRQYLDIVPSMGLIGHQWRKHGSCSGLTQADYFAVTRAARERLALPAELASTGQTRDLSVASIETAFAVKNPGMTREMIAVTCEGRLIEEIRICFDKELRFRACPEIDRRACRRDAVLLPAAP
ncbi:MULTISPECIES: ribonuclease T(2) [Sinorhizobium]|uniref:Putative ribonuclease T2 family protein n=1 Tax=Sinorhizobium fredii (strain USDA 257) TaxID=1185652 RepID=I3X0T3_SINF2|nr:MULTISPECIES: ribonuclease T(2) [Sinorhizobium]AFL49489.1 putative ribonuclease T2 family protein [Sinorhizobium fredii USDA 257]